jgi:hypothetical protein
MRTDGLREIASDILQVQQGGVAAAGLRKAHYAGLLESVAKAVLPQAADEIDDLRKRLAGMEALVARARAMSIKVLAVTNDSDGVAGWHLNGDVALWGEFAFPDDAAAFVRDTEPTAPKETPVG